MFHKISQKLAMITMIALLAVVMLFHVLILARVIPYTIVWAGKLNTVEELQVMEAISIGINAILFFVLLLKANYVKNRIPDKVLNFVIWLFVIIFSVNTIGNLFSKTLLELYLFTPLTLISTILCLRIVLGRE